MLSLKYRLFVVSVLSALLGAVPAFAGRVVILGFDGVDPGVASTMMDAGELLQYGRGKGAA